MERGKSVRSMLKRGLLGYFGSENNQVLPDSFLQSHEMSGDLTKMVNFIGGGREAL